MPKEPRTVPADVPRAVTRDRIRAALNALDLVGFTDDEGDIGVQLVPYTFYFVRPEDGPILGVASWHRGLNIRYVREATQVVSQFNAEHYCPKLYTLVTDEGDVRLRISHVFNWVEGANDKQLRDEVDTFLRSGLTAFRILGSAFPDPWVYPDADMGEDDQ